MKTLKLTQIILVALFFNQLALGQNVIDTYNKECGQTFGAIVNKTNNNFRFVRTLNLKDPNAVAKMAAVEKLAYKFYKERKLYNYITPDPNEQVHIGLAQYKDRFTEELRGYRVDFLFGQDAANRVRMYFAINNQRNLLLRLVIDPPTKQQFWICQGFAAKATKGDTHLYTLATQAGPHFDYPTTDYQYNIKEVFDVRQLPAFVVKIGENYRINQMKLRPTTRIEWTNQQHVFVINGEAVGYIIGFNYHNRDDLLNGGGLYVYLNHAGKIIAERNWQQ